MQLNYKSVNYVIQELVGNKQAPYFPYTKNQITGDITLCINQTKTYQFLDLCKIPGKATWSLSAGTTAAVITSFTDYTVTVKALTNGPELVTLTADFGNGITDTKVINVGSPVINPTKARINNLFGWYYAGVAAYGAASVTPPPAATSYRWTIEVDNDGLTPFSSSSNPRYARFTVNNSISSLLLPAQISTTNPTVDIDFGNYTTSYIVSCYAVNACGETPFIQRYVSVSKNNPCYLTNPTETRFAVSPNPIKDGTVTVSIRGDQVPCNPPGTYSRQANADPTKDVKIYDMQGNLKFNATYKEEDTFIIRDINLKAGYYVLNIMFATGENAKQIIIVQ